MGQEPLQAVHPKLTNLCGNNHEIHKGHFKRPSTQTYRLFIGCRLELSPVPFGLYLNDTPTPQWIRCLHRWYGHHSPVLPEDAAHQVLWSISHQPRGLEDTIQAKTAPRCSLLRMWNPAVIPDDCSSFGSKSGGLIKVQHKYYTMHVGY